MEEYRIRITAGHGYTEADAEKLLDIALERVPADGPVVSLDQIAGDLSLIVAREAPSYGEALQYGETLVHSLVRLAELGMQKIVAIEVELAAEVAEGELTTA